mmetsp:Transcript_48601/g.123280  ORF Transcript_48601/g.123280 Transcript_48601/m.123280 type:complete len:88 (-) Transcript_48601:1675-1938(-)
MLPARPDALPDAEAPPGVVGVGAATRGGGPPAEASEVAVAVQLRDEFRLLLPGLGVTAPEAMPLETTWKAWGKTARTPEGGEVNSEA